MAKNHVDKDRAHYEGPDKPFYENSGGRLNPSPSFGNDDGFGTPSDPGVRGEAYGGSHAHNRSMGGKNNAISQFFKGKKG